jgi:hypothetical protein
MFKTAYEFVEMIFNYIIWVLNPKWMKSSKIRHTCDLLLCIMNCDVNVECDVTKNQNVGSTWYILILDFISVGSMEALSPI